MGVYSCPGQESPPPGAAKQPPGVDKEAAPEGSPAPPPHKAGYPTQGTMVCSSTGRAVGRDAKCGAIKLTNPLGETGWQPTVGRIELWDTDVQNIRAIFDGASVPHDAVRHSCGSEEVAIERAKRMKKYLIDKYEERLRTQWRPAQ